MLSFIKKNISTMSPLEIIKHSIYALFVILASKHIVHAQDDQSGFISLDCGLTKSSENYTEPTTGIKYISDEPFVTGGVSRMLPLEYRDGYQKQYESLRAFPEGIRNCYTLNVSKGTGYIIRAGFYYGNYDNQSFVPSFFIHIGVNLWEAVEFFIDVPFTREIIHYPLEDDLRVCLVNNGTGTPIITSLELRPVMNDTYRAQSGSLRLDKRTDLGTITNRSYGYPIDALDRDWFYRDLYNFQPNWTTISTPLDVNPGVFFKPPSVIMKTAITPNNSKKPLFYSWYDYDIADIQYVYLHFAEIEKLKANESRSFDIFVDGKRFYGPVVPKYLNVTTILFTTSSKITDKFMARYNFSLVQSENSTHPPILNAIEIYSLLDLSQSETNKNDVEAIFMIKSTYKVKRNWDGDPCAPIKYLWTGLTCSYDGSDPPRITALNLSSSGLTGVIDSHLSKLTMLQSLDLSNNELSGTVPEFLSELQHLTVLKLDNNNFTGSVPATLIEKSKNGSLKFSYVNFDGLTPAQNSTSQCGSSECKRKKKNVLLPIVASAGGFILLLFVTGSILIGVRRRNRKSVANIATEPAAHNGLFEAKNRQFTYAEVLNMTNDFEVVLGRGGFGTVYHGFIGETQVAVKMLSASSAQGYQQFQAEVKLLVTVHHRNLTSLVGYCVEGTNMALIYEYMANGDLHSHLLDENNADVLSWERRLHIALESAQGLEYLHSGCKPPIVHRDIKATNILLNEHFQAKLADFGLSKSFTVDGDSHVSTIVAGTPGYLDPEYSSTNWLTEKSDVYSFGVVLLEMITGRSAILTRGNERSHISQWVSSMLSNGDINNIIDKRLKGNFEASSAWKAVEMAMACVSQSSGTRPNMGQVVTELKECVVAEMAGKSMTRSPDSTNTTGLQSPINVNFETGPLLR